MDRKTTSLMTAAAALAALPAASQAQQIDGPAVPRASSYAELLDPVPNAVERLKAVQREPEAPARLIEAQYHHHHHHHHSNYWYRQRGYYWNGWAWVPRVRYYRGGYGGYYGGGYYHHHHHHHHHHHNNY